MRIAQPLPDTSWYSDPIDGIEVISQQTQNTLQSCGCNTQACVADALDDYANALEKAVELRPPPPARSTPSTQTAARGSRVAAHRA